MAKGVVIEFNANVARFTSSVDRMTNDLAKFQTNADRISKNVNRSFERLGSGLQGVFGGIAAAVSLRELGQMADSFSNIQARLKLATRDANEFAKANENIIRIATITQAPLEETARLYTRISAEMIRVGKTQQEISDTTEAFALAMRISGVTASEAASALQQFSQVAIKGKMSGDEFTALTENAQRFIQALQDGAGITGEQMMKLAHDQKLSFELISNALKSQLGKLRSEAETLPKTIGGAFTALGNEALLAVGEIDKITGASKKVAETIGLITEGVQAWKNFITPNDQQEIVKRLEAIRFEMDAILAQRKLISNLGFDSSSFRSNALNEFNSEALKLQKNLRKVQEDSEAAEKASKKAAEEAAALAKKKAEEAAKAAEAEEKRIKAQKEAEKAAKALASQQKNFIENLEKEAKVLGMTAAQAKVYEASLLKITGARLDGVRANAERIEAFQVEQKVLEDMRESYAEAAESYLKFIGTVAKDNKAAAEKVERLKVELGLVDKSEAQQKRMLALYDLEVKVKERLKELDGLDTGDSVRKIQEEAILKAKASEEEAIRLEEQINKHKSFASETQKVWDNFAFNFQRNLGDQLFNTFEGKFDNIGKSWKSLLLRMASDAAAANLSKLLLGADGTGGSGLLGKGLSLLGSVLGLFGGGGAGGGTASYTGYGGLGAPRMFAKGGIVDSPTPFRFAEGGAFRSGLMGEAGPEAIMPLKRDSQGRLGVSVQGRSGGGIVLNQTINIDSRTDRAEVHALVSRAVRQGNAELVDRLGRQGVI